MFNILNNWFVANTTLSLGHVLFGFLQLSVDPPQGSLGTSGTTGNFLEVGLGLCKLLGGIFKSCVCCNPSLFGLLCGGLGV